MNQYHLLKLSGSVYVYNFHINTENVTVKKERKNKKELD